MPRFFFHVHDGESKIDTEGCELPSWKHAQIQAITFAGEFIRDRARLLKLGEDWSMEVTDETGLILFHLDFQISGSSAIADDIPST